MQIDVNPYSVVITSANTAVARMCIQNHACRGMTHASYKLYKHANLQLKCQTASLIKSFSIVVNNIADVVCSNFINSKGLERGQLVFRVLDHLINDRRTFDLLKARSRAFRSTHFTR